MTAHKILIIEDDRVTVELAAAALRRAGYQVSVAYDAMQGSMFAQRDPPDLIVLDLQMPAGGGLQVWDRLERSSRTQGVPILIMTASPGDGLEEELLAKGAVGFLSKPFHPEDLTRAVREALAAPPSG